MRYASDLTVILLEVPLRARVLGVVSSLGLPDCWVGAGFVRNAVWDHLHGRVAVCHEHDVDVLWFCPERLDPLEDRRLETVLRIDPPTIHWSVKNQARMHLRNGDGPYGSVIDAMRHWPETATAVAVRLTTAGNLEIAAPFGLDDLFEFVVRPTPNFALEKRHIYWERVQTKGWLTTWPLLRTHE